MLRYVLRIFRRKDANGEVEEWVNYMQRSAQTVDTEREQHNIEEWSLSSRRQKWRFAGKTARQADDRWSRLLLEWQPTFGHGRLPGRPKTRWCDSIAAYAGGNWVEIAADVEFWSVLEHGYVNRIV